MTATTMAANAGQEPVSKQAKIDCAEPKLLVKKLSENATLPVRGSTGAAGYDLARFVAFTCLDGPDSTRDFKFANHVPELSHIRLADSLTRPSPAHVPVPRIP